MADRPSGSGARLIMALCLLLVGAIGVVTWLALKPEPPQPAPKKAPVAVHAPETPAAPRAPRPRALEPVPLQPNLPPADGGGGKTPPEAEARDTVKLDVLVLGSSGLPAPGATVALLDPFAQHAASPRPAELARAKADDAGHAKFEATSRMLRAYAWLGSEAGASDKFRAEGEKFDVVVRLAAAIAAHGRVVDTGGEPVPGAAVRFLASPWFGDAFGLLLETKSADDGTFDLPSIPASAFDAENAAFAIEARAKDWPMTRMPVTADTLRAGEVVVTLERGAFLRGRLVTPSGVAISAEEVRLADGRSSVSSAPDGKFELPLPRAGGTVIALPGAHANPKSVVGGGAVQFRRIDIAAKVVGRFRGDGGDIDLGDVTITAGQAVKGVVVDSGGQPFKAADVVLYLAGVQVAATQTDDAGKFEIADVGDDAHVLVATEAPGDNAWTGRRHASVDGVRGGASDVRVEITGALTVLVKFLAEADNSPVVVPEVTLRAAATGTTPKSYGWTWAGSRIASVRFEVEHAGTYDVTVEIPGYEPATATGVEVSPDREKPIDVLFKKLP
jgi:hypothetical protein